MGEAARARRGPRTARSWQADGAGFSSVVGVILVIAIVIALGAATFVMVDKARQNANIDDAKPELGMSIDANDPEATVVKVDDDLDYVRDLRFSGTCAPTLNGGPMPTAEGRLVAAGDILRCDWGQELVISSSEAKGNSVLFRHTF